MFSCITTVEPNPRSDWPLLTGCMVVVWAQPETDRLFLMAKDRLHKPLNYSYSMVLNAIEQGDLVTGTRELPEVCTTAEGNLRPATRRKRDEWYAVIEPLIPHIEEYLVGGYGPKLIARRAEETGKSRQQIYDYVHRYLKNGQNRSAVIPDLHACGKPKKGERKIGDRKLGRPRSNTDFHGRNFLPEDQKNLAAVLREHYIQEEGCTLKDCRQQLLDDYYYASVSYDANGDRCIKHVHPDYRPSVWQFNYHAKKFLDPQRERVERIRAGSTDYDKDRRGRSGNPPIARGPGQIYQLDATEYDMELVSQLSPDRTLRSGRCTFYEVIDAFSGMTVGMHLSMEAPSWGAARLALFNAFRSKPEYCRELGIEIDKAQWPVEGKCHTVFVDNLELQSQIGEPGPQDAGFDVAFGRVRRGDDKGLVEQAIRRKGAAARNLPGYIRKRKHNKSARQNPKLEACLTLRELHQFLIHETLHQNNVVGIDEKYLDAEMVADGVQAVPREIWNWGEQNRPFLRTGVPEEQLYLEMLEKGVASVRQQGVFFINPTGAKRKGLWYRCPWTLSKGIQNRKEAGNRSPRFEVRFMRHNLDVILLVTPDGLVPAYLQDRERRLHGLPLEEIAQRQDVEAAERNAREPAERESRANVNARRVDMVSRARKEQRHLPPARVAHQSITDNREADLAEERRDESDRFRRAIESQYGTNPPPGEPPASPAEPAKAAGQRGRSKQFFNALKQRRGNASDDETDGR